MQQALRRAIASVRMVTLLKPVAGFAVREDVPTFGKTQPHVFLDRKSSPTEPGLSIPSESGQLPGVGGVYPAMANAAAGAFRRPSRKVLIIAAVVLAAVFIALWHGLSLQWLHDRAEEANGSVVLLALMVLPLVGFPVSVLHAVAGARFGLPMGLTLVGVSIAMQLAASYLIVRAAPKFFARRFSRLRRRLPPTTHRSLTLFTMVLPGAPYFAQNYVPVLVGVPFRVFFIYGFPIHFARSISGVIFGEWSGDMTPSRIVVFAIYSVVVTVVCGLAFRRLRAQLRNQPPAESDLKRCE